MINELEKQFFDTFGIEPKSVKRTLKLAMQGYDENDLPEDLKQFIRSQTQVYNDYPQITDRILLELICIDFNENPYKCRGGQTSVDEVKERILSDFIHEFENDLYLDKENIKHKVCTLFEEK